MLLRNSLTQKLIQVMVLLPGSRFLLVKDVPNSLWELSFSIWAQDHRIPPMVVVKSKLIQLLMLHPYDNNHVVIPLLDISSQLDNMDIKVFLVKITKMFTFPASSIKQFKTSTMDEIVNDILYEGQEYGVSSVYSSTSMTILRNIGGSELLWDKRLINFWEKKSSLSA